jgi:Skp family chaperone for outer membrane proteins
MIDWSLPPELQKKYNEVASDIKKLQDELGIKPKTIEERAQYYQQKREEERRQAEELSKLQKITGQRRPPPRWKV